MNIDFDTSNSIIKSINPTLSISLKTYKNRLNNYNKYVKQFLNKHNNECLTIIKTKQGEYRIESLKLILKHRIGSNSRYGAIFLTTNSKKQFYATKLTVVDDYNYNEIVISTKLSNITKENKSPHFLLIYKYLKCYNTFNIKLPTIIKQSNYFMMICELASGNLKQFLYEYEHEPTLILNAFQQVLMTILAFHHFTGGYFHSDCHYKNFLYHKIKPGGYFHYNIYGKDIYIENKGYIFVIWDFGLVKTNSHRVVQRLEDYFKITSIIYSMFKYKNNHNQLVYILSSILKYKHTYITYFLNHDKDFFTKLLFSLKDLFLYELPSSKTKGSNRIINDIPYQITDF